MKLFNRLTTDEKLAFLPAGIFFVGLSIFGLSACDGGADAEHEEQVNSLIQTFAQAPDQDALCESFRVDDAEFITEQINLGAEEMGLDERYTVEAVEEAFGRVCA